MTSAERNLRDRRIWLFIRQVPLALIGISGILISLSGLTGLLDNIDFLRTRLPTITLFAAGAIASYLAFERFSIRGDIAELKPLISAIGESGKGFRKVPASEISTVAAQMVKDVKILRTLGTARQDLLDIDESARLYLRETENRVRRGKPPLNYYRITSDHLRETFIGHLTLMLTTAPDSRHDIQIELIPNIETTVTYQIFDSSHVLIILDNPHVPGRRDYTVALMSSDQEIVDGFIVHFDDAWSHQKPIKDPHEFRRMVTRLED